MHVIGWPLLLLVIGFFFGARWLLGKLGVSIYLKDVADGPPSA